MFVLFTSLADAYSKVLMPPKGLNDKLRNSVADMTTVLEWERERSQEQARQKAEDEIEQERLQMAMIDWHDFVVVDTIDFADNEHEDEDLPPPMTVEEVIIRRGKISIVDNEEETVEVAMDMDEEEVQLVKPMEEENEPPMRIVKNWKSRIPAERDPTKYFVVSPITGERIPISEMSEHMRISLIDPKYKEQKDRMFAKIRETTLAADDKISRNIVGLARTRPDIFGTTEEEVSNAVKREIEKPKQVIQAMSQNSNDVRNQSGPPPKPSMPAVRPPIRLQYSVQTSGGITAPPPPVFSVIPSIRPPPPSMPMMMMHGQHLMPNLPPPGSQFMPFGVTMPQPGMLPMVVPPPITEEPEPKRQRLGDTMLVPEGQFLARHSGGPVRISVSVDQGNRKGQLLEITVQSLGETVGSLKEKIAGEIQLSSNKQKLSSSKAGILKDNFSLAYYNVSAGDTLSLTLRERGGRKR